MGNKTLNAICFVVSVVLFILGFIVSFLAIVSAHENLTRAIVGIAWMGIGAFGVIYIIHLLNKDLFL